MSQFSTMTTRERKIQAAAICREVQGPEDVEIDLGKKMSVPKEIMFEELSLASNRGSRLFKMRQRRSEKYTFENIQNKTNVQLNEDMMQQSQSNGIEENQRDEKSLTVDQLLKTPNDMADTGAEPNPEKIAPGYGGPLKDIVPEKFNSTAVPRSYHSPWDKAIINESVLTDNIITQFPEPGLGAELPSYKSFNRVATPFGGFSKSPRPAPIRIPEMEPLPEYPDLQGDTGLRRPSFNRIALGWVSAGNPVVLPTVALEPTVIPESDDL